MAFYRLTSLFISQAEKRLGVVLDYTRHIARTDVRLLLRYNRLFGFLDPVNHVSPEAYHIARLRAAITADCGTCVAAELNLAKSAGVDAQDLKEVLAGRYLGLSNELRAVATLTDAVVGRREDDAISRDIVREHFGEAGLIELSFAMNGAALLPGIKRSLGYAVSCDMEIARRLL